ncbi:hypothetical protein NP233_g4569 [Leucocoprinus birnbaumii]|uniref:GH16 domain-containing protein n=1 Tax=Leucocoprinus birnbaumii TaxID=56174 RepID=A0AAD5YXH2_9AGAR|nr:hypothetical protein NP233_g4569 [Leucocoprinus birnbaumii]
MVSLTDNPTPTSKVAASSFEALLGTNATTRIGNLEDGIGRHVGGDFDTRSVSDKVTSWSSYFPRMSALHPQYSLAPSPRAWGMPLMMNSSEPDDYLHNPDPKRDRKSDQGGTICTSRGIANLGCLFILVAGMMMLFAGFPVLQHFLKKKPSNQGGFNLGGTNATGQVPNIPGNYMLIDKDTPKDAYTKKSYMYPNQKLQLVFSDEFNQDGRTFYPGDDPFWEAVDLHYWGTNDLEWYDPQQATTEGGALRLRLAQVANPADNHNMKYRSGMIQSWNKFCFTGGLVETSVTLPGGTKVSGLWPAMYVSLLILTRLQESADLDVAAPFESSWAMGNLGRAGYGATLEGMWPYSYDACDVGTLPNQTFPGTQNPAAALSGGDPQWDGVLSFLPGQRLSACTCPGESHPGPVRSDGTYVGRAAPEIDVFEATIAGGIGQVSQSAQWAPYNAGYKWLNNSDNLIIYDPQITELNAYHGGVYQQTTSGLSNTNQSCYELETGCFAVYGFEYKPGFDKSYITWVNNGVQAWTMMGAGMAADPETQIHARPVPVEPMYLIANLGFSPNFGYIDFDNLQFPATMSVDYIRVYQPEDAINIGCDPVDYPTMNYIQTFEEAYTNFNLTLWNSPNYPNEWPKNRLNGGSMIYLFWAFYAWLFSAALGAVVPAMSPLQLRQIAQDSTLPPNANALPNANGPPNAVPPNNGVPNPNPDPPPGIVDTSTLLGLPTAGQVVTITFGSSTFTSTVPSSTTTITHTTTPLPSITGTITAATTVIEETITTVLETEPPATSGSTQAVVTGSSAESNSNGAVGSMARKGGRNFQLVGAILLGLLLVNH